MQKEFENDDAVACEISFESVNILEALFPNVLGDERGRELLGSKNLLVHANDEYFFVVGAVEDADFSTFRNGLVSAPEVIVIEFFGARSFEGVHIAALGVDAGHDVFDDAVFASSVHRLQNNQKGPAVLRIEFFLNATEELDAVVEKFCGAFLVVKLAG